MVRMSCRTLPDIGQNDFFSKEIHTSVIYTWRNASKTFVFCFLKNPPYIRKVYIENIELRIVEILSVQ